MTKLFLPQTTLEEWMVAEQADLKDDKLHVASDKAVVPLLPAVHFVKMVSGDDSKKLLQRVKTEAQLKELGAEHMMESVLLGDDAYEVINGYLASVGEAKAANETELLAAMFLNKL